LSAEDVLLRRQRAIALRGPGNIGAAELIPQVIGTAALSPDGQHVAYATGANRNDPGAIYVANIDGRGQPVPVATGWLDAWVAPAAGATSTATTTGK
jgi:hypothetical protein